MRKLVLALLIAVGGCTPGSIVSAPATVADQVKLDEQVAIGAEVMYTTASTFGNTLSRTGVIDRPRFQELDRRAYAALGAVRAAYRAGNAADFVAAYAQLNTLVAQVRDLKEK